MARDEEIEFVEITINLRIEEMDRGMNQSNFSFVFREIMDEFLIEMMEIVKQNIFVFAAWMGNRSSAIFVAVELKIIGALSEAKNVGMLVFVDGIVEEVNIVELIDSLDKFCGYFGAPVAFARKGASIGRIFAVKIVIAEGDEDGRDGAKIGEPSGETFEPTLALDGVE